MSSEPLEPMTGSFSLPSSAQHRAHGAPDNAGSDAAGQNYGNAPRGATLSGDTDDRLHHAPGADDRQQHVLNGGGNAGQLGNSSHVILAAFLFFCLSVVGAYVCYSAVDDFSSARASGKWAQASGIVLSPHDGSSRVRYAYIVDGKRHEAQRLSYLTRGLIGSPPNTEPGARVTVYVSPDDPGDAVLVPGGSGRRFAVWFAFGGLIVFVGFAGLIRATMAIDFPELSDPAARAPVRKPADRDLSARANGFSGSGYSPAE